MMRLGLATETPEQLAQSYHICQNLSAEELEQSQAETQAAIVLWQWSEHAARSTIRDSFRPKSIEAFSADQIRKMVDAHVFPCSCDDCNRKYRTMDVDAWLQQRQLDHIRQMDEAECKSAKERDRRQDPKARWWILEAEMFLARTPHDPRQLPDLCPCYCCTQERPLPLEWEIKHVQVRRDMAARAWLDEFNALVWAREDLQLQPSDKSHPSHSLVTVADVDAPSSQTDVEATYKCDFHDCPGTYILPPSKRCSVAHCGKTLHASCVTRNLRHLVSEGMFFCDDHKPRAVHKHPREPFTESPRPPSMIDSLLSLCISSKSTPDMPVFALTSLPTS